MASKTNKFEFTSDEIKRRYIDEIIAYFQDERGEAIGVIAAEGVLEFFVDLLGDELYKKAISDSKKLIRENLGELEVELDLLTPTK